MSTHAHRGATYNSMLDADRLNTLGRRVLALMLDNQWRTLAEIVKVTGGSEGGVSARLRELRRPEFGGWIVDHNRRSKGLWEYRVSAPEPSEVQPCLF